MSSNAISQLVEIAEKNEIKDVKQFISQGLTAVTGKKGANAGVVTKFEFPKKHAYVKQLKALGLKTKQAERKFELDRAEAIRTSTVNTAVAMLRGQINIGCQKLKDGEVHSLVIASDVETRRVVQTISKAQSLSALAQADMTADEAAELLKMAQAKIDAIKAKAGAIDVTSTAKAISAS